MPQHPPHPTASFFPQFPSSHSSPLSASSPLQPLSPPSGPSRTSIRRPRHPAETIDLTSSPPSDLSVPSSSSKRRRLSPPGTTNVIDLISLPEEEELQRKAHEEAVAAARKDSERLKRLADVSCVICMEDEVTDLSATPCGHLFCSRCLHAALVTGGDKKSQGRCPMCRHTVRLKEVVVLEIKKRTKGKEKAAVAEWA